MASRALIAAVTAASIVFAVACTGDSGGSDLPTPSGASSEAPVPCPKLGPARRIGHVGGEGATRDPAVQGISGLAVSLSEPEDPLRGGPIAWALGDRFANELAGEDSVLVFALDPTSGDELSRFALTPSSLEPGPAGDPVTSLEDTEDALPDFEDLSVEPRSDGSNRIWLFDTGNNNGNRDHLNVYVVVAPEPGPAPSPGQDTEMVEPIRYPIRLGGSTDFPALNIEAAMTDPERGNRPLTVYLIPKFPVDLDDAGSTTDFPVFAFEPDPDDTSAAMNVAAIVGYLTLDDPALRVTAASMSQDGAAFAIRAVSGGEPGQPNLDLVGLWQRDPTTPVADVLEARPTPDCTWSFDTAEGSSAEETLAFDLRKGPGWSGLLWTHDERDPGAPLFAAVRR